MNKRLSPFNKKFWIINRGFSKKDAKNEVKKVQNTGSLQVYIKKYGEQEGTKRFKKRQIDWQKTLNSKTFEEIVHYTRIRISYKGNLKRNAIL